MDDRSGKAELLRFLGRQDLRRLWAGARERIERLGEVRGTVRLPAATGEERRAVADLLGLATLPADEPRISLDRLDRALRESRFQVDLRTALSLLGGPLRDRAGEREQELSRRRKLWAEAESHPVVSSRPGLRDWLTDLRESGLLRRLTGTAGDSEERLLGQALAVLDALACSRAVVRLPVLANEVLGSSHALDAGRPVASLVLRALSCLAGRLSPRSTLERRELWESAGVITDDLSCDLLVLGLAPAGGGWIGEGLRAFAAAGEPVRITLRQLVACDLIVPPGLLIRVCENPAVVAAAADRCGGACAPLVCLGGFLNHAGWKLLTSLMGQGAEIAYHGDFDWAGLRIGNKLREAVPFRPWRFTSAEYRTALTVGGDRSELQGPPVVAEWDPELGRAMAEAGVAIEEEAVLEDLLRDLPVARSMQE